MHKRVLKVQELKELKLKSFAKINLALDVTGIREDGYHMVETVMQQVSLYDEIIINWQPDSSGELNIIISNSKPYLPTDHRNLAYKAAMLMSEGRSLSGTLKIHMEKKIPVAAGLGGGSGNGAAVMIGLNRIWKLGLNTMQLCEMGKALGADVPFCILVQNSKYTCALGTGAGETLTPLKRGIRRYLLLAKPAFGVSTKEVFKSIDSCVIESRPDIKQLMEGLASEEYEKVYDNMVNVLEYYTLEAYPEVKKLKDKIQNTKDVRKVLMSGSGPTVMGIYDTYTAAKKACLQIRKQGYEAYWLTAGKGSRGEKHVKL